jgi:diguanylate cyclase (GGDEF)-like protein/PAS domain S-box-containing protein
MDQLFLRGSYMQLADILLDMVSDSVLLLNAEGQIIQINRIATRVLGYSSTELEGRPLARLRSSAYTTDGWSAILTQMNETNEWYESVSLRKKNGESYAAWAWGRRLPQEGWVVFLSEVPHREMLPDEARFKASQYDFLTGLPNRFYLMQQLKTTLALAKRHVTRFVVLYLNLDGVNSINVLLGYEVGDALLQQVAKRLENRMREIDIVARMGGDEFVVVITEGRRMEEMIRIARTVHKWLQTPFSLRDTTVTVSASTGIAVYPDDSQDLGELVHHARSAMLQGKAAGAGHFCFYNYNNHTE